MTAFRINDLIEDLEHIYSILYTNNIFWLYLFIQEYAQLYLDTP